MRKPIAVQPKHSMQLAVDEQWKKTKRKDTYGNLSGFTFRAKNGHIFVNLGAPKEVKAEGADEPVYRFHIEVSHAAHYNDRRRQLGVSFNDRVFFAEGDIVTRNPDPVWATIKGQVEQLVETYNIAVMRVGRVFNVPDELLDSRYDIPGGYMLLAAKVAINARKGVFECVYPDAYTDPLLDWDLKVHYQIKATTDGFRYSKQSKGEGVYGKRTDHYISVPEDQLGTEVDDKNAGETLRAAGEELHAALIEHVDRLRDMALKAADESVPLKERRQAARELDGILQGNISHRMDYSSIGAPSKPVKTVTEAIKGLLTLLPTPEDEERDYSLRY